MMKERIKDFFQGGGLRKTLEPSVNVKYFSSGNAGTYFNNSTRRSPKQLRSTQCYDNETFYSML